MSQLKIDYSPYGAAQFRRYRQNIIRDLPREGSLRTSNTTHDCRKIDGCRVRQAGYVAMLPLAFVVDDNLISGSQALVVGGIAV